MQGVSKHGRLRVSNSKLVDEDGKPFIIYGMSTHGLNHFPQYVNEKSFTELKQAWNTNCVRQALYLDGYNGYCNNSQWHHMSTGELLNIMKKGIELAIKLDMYVIVDWHVLVEENPLKFKEQAKAFFEEITSLYGSYPNLIYEICNEPNHCSWEDVKKYAEEIIPVIRKKVPDSVIIVGTLEWCQRLDLAAEDPLDFDNLLYALHFYATTHVEWLRERTKRCIDGGLPVIVSEFGITDCTGDGIISIDEAEQWKKLITDYGLSFMCWSLSNHPENSAVIKQGCDKLDGFTDDDLKEQGIWVRKWFNEMK